MLITKGLSFVDFYRRALVFIMGEGAVDKAVELSGCECEVEGCKIVVDKVMPPPDNPNRKPLNCGGLNIPGTYICS